MANCEVNIMMFGGRRCGKTSVIAAMKENFDSVSAGGNLVINPEEETFDVIQAKMNDIGDIFSEKKYGEFSTDGRPSDDGMEYRLNIRLRNKRQSDSITLSLYDYPGEWLDDKNQSKDDYKRHTEILGNMMKRSNIIMVAIDTPYLMQETHTGKSTGVGKYNDRRNYCQKIAHMVKDYFCVGDGESPKMILLVPLKCEKYYDNDQMDDVRTKVEVAYTELLRAAASHDKGRFRYEVAITPILTFGENTVEFTRFNRGKDGMFITTLPSLDGNGVVDYKYPTQPLFHFVDRDNDYSPQHCEQPLLYALMYLLKRIEEVKQAEIKNEGIFDWLVRSMGEAFFNWQKLTDFQRESGFISEKLKKSGNGYKILQNPMGF